MFRKEISIYNERTWYAFNGLACQGELWRFENFGNYWDHDPSPTI